MCDVRQTGQELGLLPALRGNRWISKHCGVSVCSWGRGMKDALCTLCGGDKLCVLWAALPAWPYEHFSETLQLSYRLKVMRSFGLLNTPPETVFDHFTETIATIFQCPFAAMCLVDEDRVYVKSGLGKPHP